MELTSKYINQLEILNKELNETNINNKNKIHENIKNNIDSQILNKTYLKFFQFKINSDNKSFVCIDDNIPENY